MLFEMPACQLRCWTELGGLHSAVLWMLWEIFGGHLSAHGCFLMSVEMPGCGVRCPESAAGRVQPGSAGIRLLTSIAPRSKALRQPEAEDLNLPGGHPQSEVVAGCSCFELHGAEEVKTPLPFCICWPYRAVRIQPKTFSSIHVAPSSTN